MGKIIGVTVGTTTPRPDWNQTDERKGDYIRNKPDYQTKIDDSLETNDKTIAGAINEVNRKGFDKISYITAETTHGTAAAPDGIYIGANIDIVDSSYSNYASGSFNYKLPIVAGENITFEKDEANDVVKINAKGGDGSNNTVLKVAVTTRITTVLSSIITAIEDAGGNINEYNCVELSGFSKGLFLMKFSSIGDAYQVNCLNVIEGYKIYNEETQNVCVPSEKSIRAFIEEGTPVTMPQIRFVSVQDTNGSMRLTEDNPFTFTVEVIGGGALQEGDQLQICVRRKSWHKNTDGTHRHKWKLRSASARPITDEDIGKRFLSITVLAGEMTSKWLFSNDKNSKYSNATADTLSYMYFRIKRITKYNNDGEQCDAIFSNVEKVAKTFDTSVHRLTIK